MPLRDLPWDALIALVLLLAGVEGFRLASDTELWSRLTSGAAAGVPVGEVAKEGGAVRYRRLGSPIWHDLAQAPEQVAEGDSVFTGREGHGIVRLKGGQSAQILPDSLITIQTRRPDDADSGAGDWLGRVKNVLRTGAASDLIEVERGKIKVTVHAGKQAVRVSVGKKVLKLAAPSAAGRDAQVEIAVDPTRPSAPARITSDSEVSLEDEAQARRMRIAPAQEIQIDHGESKVVARPFSRLEPQEGMKFVRAPGPGGFTLFKTSFSWEVLDPAGIGREVALEIRGREPHVVRLARAARAASVSLRAGTYEWRLRAADLKGQEISSDWSSFSIVPLLPPGLTGPADGAKFLQAEQGLPASVGFGWGKPASGTSLALELSRDGDPAPFVRAIEDETEIQMSLQPGHYRWRLQIRDSSGRETAWSASRGFTVMSLLSFRDVSARIKAALPGSTDARKVLFAASWSPIPGVTSYEFAVTDSRGHVLRSGRTQGSRIEFGWRGSVRALTGYQLRLAAACAGGRRCEANAPFSAEILAPKAKGAISRSLASGRRVLLSWERTTATDSYRLQLSRSSDFGKPEVDRAVSKNWEAVRVPGAGTYFWRVRSEVGGEAGEWSSPGEIRVK